MRFRSGNDVGTHRRAEKWKHGKPWQWFDTLKLVTREAGLSCQGGGQVSSYDDPGNACRGRKSQAWKDAQRCKHAGVALLITSH